MDREVIGRVRSMNAANEGMANEDGHHQRPLPPTSRGGCFLSRDPLWSRIVLFVRQDSRTGQAAAPVCQQARIDLRPEQDGASAPVQPDHERNRCGQYSIKANELGPGVVKIETETP